MNMYRICFFVLLMVGCSSVENSQQTNVCENITRELWTATQYAWDEYDTIDEIKMHNGCIFTTITHYFYLKNDMIVVNATTNTFERQCQIYDCGPLAVLDPTVRVSNGELTLLTGEKLIKVF